MNNNQKNNPPKIKGETISRLVKYIFADYKKQFIFVCLCIIISAITSVCGTLFIKTLIDDYITPLMGIENPVYTGLLNAILIMGLIYLVGIIANFLYSRIMVNISQGVLKKIRDEMFEKMQRLPIKYFDTHKHGDIMSFYTNDVDTLGQVVSGIIVVIYMAKYKNANLEWKHLKVNISCVGEVAAIGMASFFNQLAMMVVQIVMNNLLKHYGALSIYGSAIPIACSGIAMKTNQLFFSVVIGIAQGSQPIESFNYGAKNYDRVKKALVLALCAGGCVSMLSFIVFQTMPRQILALFGNGTEEYFTFGVMFMRRFLFAMFLNFMHEEHPEILACLLYLRRLVPVMLMII